MVALAKTVAGPGLTLIEAPEPSPGTGEVKIRVEAGSICGTDLHIDQWDPWAAGRMSLPRIVGHEFCGTVVAVGPGVDEGRIGQFVASESHVVPTGSAWLAAGLGHVDPDTRILGVDVDGGFAEYAVVPEANARATAPGVPRPVAALQDALGNAVHTALAGPVADRDVLVTGMGPIGLMSVGVLRTAGARRITVVEPSPYRQGLARQMGADVVLAPGEETGEVDVTLEMSGHPASLALAVRATRPGGRISLLGVYKESPQPLDVNEAIFKGLTIQGIVGRRLWETWDQMAQLFARGLDVSPVVTHVVPLARFREAYDAMAAGQAGKVVLTFGDWVK